MNLEHLFRQLARLQVKHSNALIAATLLITLFHIAGIYNIYLETDFSKFLPQDNPAIMLGNRVRDTFSGQDMVFILVKLDASSTSPNAIKDIRNPRVMKMLLDLEEEVSSEPSVDRIQSAGTLFKKDGVPPDIRTVKQKLGGIPLSSDFFNRDYTATTVLVLSNVGTGKEKIKALTNAIEDSIEETPIPPGVSLSVTGNPPLRVLIADILISDANYTILLSSAIILVLLIAIHMSVTRGILVFNPLVFGLIWTLGTMGWLGLPLSMVTVGVGAMILGLGVEYSVFLVSRYSEERSRGAGQEDSIFTALNEVGTAIVGSSTTTIVGFLSLMFSVMPLLHDLGKTLALGIFYCVFSALVINPPFIVFEEDTVKKLVQKAACAAAGGSCNEGG